MAAPISREDYLKRYLSVNAEEKKKKKRKKAHATAKVSRVKIFDDDIDLKSLQPDNLSNTFDDDVGDNEPTVADVIDERPEHIKLLEKYRSSGAWKTFENSEEKHSKKRHDSDSDNSPSRRKRHDSDFDQSPVRRQRHDSDSDQSTSRRQRHDSDSDQSPARRQRHNSDSDQSPARKRHNSDSDQSPARRQRHDSDADQSPARRQRHDSDSDQSPHRKQHSKSKSDRLQRHKNSNPEQRRQDSPQRKKTKTSSRTHYSDSDQSPPRRRGNKSDSDQSPPRKHGKKPDSDESPPRKSKLFRSKDLTPDGSRSGKGNKKNEEMTLGGKKAGLSSAKDMRREADELRRKEDQSFRQISDDQLGRGSATVFRDKSGRKRNLAEEREKKSEEAKKKEKDDEKFKQWGKGLKQIEEQSQRLESDLYETTKPLARYKDDEDLDQMLREMDRAEDPMLAFIKKKKNKSAGPAVNEKPRYKGRAPPPNRFGIMPGYRWDGVDRSNGFEKQMFSKIAEKKATATHAYKWSTEDM